MFSESTRTSQSKVERVLRFDLKSVDSTFLISPLTPGKFRGKIRGKFQTVLLHFELF